jgi:hypothetical protein
MLLQDYCIDLENNIINFRKGLTNVFLNKFCASETSRKYLPQICVLIDVGVCVHFQINILNPIFGNYCFYCNK